MTSQPNASAQPDAGGVDIILVAGLWLDGSVWTDVAADLERRGHRPIVVTLPGQGAEPDDASLGDQVAATLAAVDAARAPLLVGHSAACALVWIAADQRPDALRRVVMIGGFPVADGHTYADFFPITDGAMPFPGWDPFEGPDSVDLDEAARRRMAANAIPVPEGVAKGVVHLSNERRLDVPVTVVCPEFSPEQIKGWIANGDVADLGEAHHVSYVDIDTGHWPMISRPDELARVLDEIAREG